MNTSRIHIVEDSKIASLHLRILLEHNGFQVTGESDSAEDALKTIPLLQPDLVLMDVMLAGKMSGTDAAQTMHEMAIPVIYLTALTDKNTIQNAKLTEPYGFIAKPFTNQEVLNTIEFALYKSAQEKKRKQQTVRQAQEEIREAEMQRQLAELKMAALQSVMSPHFIFNTLNSIQYFVARNDRENAIGRLSTFAKLIRSIMRSSKNGKIFLKDELELLSNYVQLEQVRFENAFTFSIRIEEDFDVSTIEIPSLLIQPYLEKSISHVLMQRDIKGEIELSVSREDNILVFKINDNRAKQLAHSSPFQLRPDKGLISEEQLKLIAQHTHIKVEVETFLSAAHLSIGSCTTIRLPLASK